jgi:group I intron endonuclease
MTGTIYVLQNKVNGKCYVGQTKKRLFQRLYEHSKNKEMLIGRSIRKYGVDAFGQYEYVGIPMDDLDHFEREMIRKLGSVFPNGYNLSLGGQKNKQMSDETKRRISEAKKGFPSPMKGKHLTEETKRKMSASLKGRSVWNKGISPSPETIEKQRQKILGRKLSEEHKRKISESAKKVIHTEEWNRNAGAGRRGKVNSPKAIEKMRIALTGRKHTEQYKAAQRIRMKEWWAERKGLEMAS